MKFPLFVFIILVHFIQFGVQAGSVFTTERCTPKECLKESTPGADNERSLGNKVNSAFKGYVDVAANAGASIFTTNIKCDAGQAWPRISEGVTTPEKTDDYPINLNDYLNLPGGRFVTYSGKWLTRTKGPEPKVTPRGPRYNGVYMWLNDPTNINGPRDPKFPWTVEINVWNRYETIPNDVQPYDNYNDSNGEYKVSGRYVEPEGDRFYAFYFLLQGGKINDMTLNTKEVLRHIQNANASIVQSKYNLIEISVAAEGHLGADGKFEATIKTMGRP